MFKIFKGKEASFYPRLQPYKKYIYPSFGALFITLSLFYLMTMLISQKKNLASNQDDSLSIQFLNTKELEDLKTTDRRAPENLKKIKKAPQTPTIKSEKKQLEKPQLSLPKQDLKLAKNIAKTSNFSVFGNQRGLPQGNSEVTPIVRIEPNYPRKAAIMGAEGFVILQFDITSLGTVTNISILQASPPEIFNRSAIIALQKWKYKPRILNNKPVLQKALKVRLDFKLEKTR
ncbi:MAG: energy transducer TonB [Bdellovibrionales bacterium]